MGLFLKEDIPGVLSPQEAIARIRSQGGLVGIPHPFGQSPFLLLRALTLRHYKQGETAPSRSGHSRPNNLLSREILSQVDTMEVFNSRTPFLNNSTKFLDLVNKYGLSPTAGSDAHTLGEIGKAYVEMPEFNGRDEFISALAQGKIFGRRSNPLFHLASSWVRMRKRSQR